MVLVTHKRAVHTRARARDGLPAWFLCQSSVHNVARIIALIYLWIIAIKMAVDIVLLIVHLALNGDSDYKYLVAIHALLLGLHTYLAIMLYMSVKSEKYGSLKCWFSTSIVVFVGELLIFVLEIYIQATAEADEAEEANSPTGKKKVNLQRVIRSPWEYFGEERILALDAIFDVIDIAEILFHVYAFIIVYKFMGAVRPKKKEKGAATDVDPSLPPPLTPPIGEVTLEAGETAAPDPTQQRKNSAAQRRAQRLSAAKIVSQRFSLTKPESEDQKLRRLSGAKKPAKGPTSPTHATMKVENETAKKPR